MHKQDLETHEPIQSPGAALADEFYAKPEPEPAPEPAVVEPAPEKKDEAAAVPEGNPEPGEKVEGQENHDLDVQAPEESGEAVSSDQEVEEFEVTSLEQLAEHLETDPDWIRGLKVTEKVNGQEIEVSLADALATHRKVTAGDSYLADAKEKALATIEVANQQKEVIASTAVTLNALLSEAEQQLQGEMSDEQMARLRREDPAEYSARMTEIRERREKLDDMRARAAQAYANTASQLTESQKAQRAQQLPQEREIFMEMVPEWNDQEVAQRESQEITEYLQAKGHSPEEIEVAAYNGKLLAYVRNSMLFERGQQKIQTAKKKVAKIPKVMKSGKTAEKQKPTAGADDRVSILYGSN